MNDEQQLDEALALWVDKLVAIKGKPTLDMSRLSDEQRVALALHQGIRADEELPSAFRTRLGQRLDREFEARKPKRSSRALFYQQMAQRPVQAVAAVLAVVFALGMVLVFLNPTVQSESGTGTAQGLSQGLVAVFILGLSLLVLYGIVQRFRR